MATVVFVLVVIVAVALLWLVYLRAIVIAVRLPESAFRAVGRSQAGTVIMIVITGFIGGSYFLLRVRPQLLRAEVSDPATTQQRQPPPDTGDIRQWRRDRDPWK